MAMIHVPRPPASAYNPNRKASALLRNQVEHMHLAERRLPERYRTKIYVNAIRTEGEVAEYIGQVTEAITRAHQDAEKKRAKSQANPGTRSKIAASNKNKADLKEKNRRAAGPTVKALGKKTLKKK
jgi:hypothetical protein